MAPLCYILCLYVYGLQQYGQLNNSWPLCFMFCSVWYLEKKNRNKIKIDVAAVCS